MSRASNGRGSIYRSKETKGWEGMVSYGKDPVIKRRLRKKVRGRTRKEVQAKVDRLVLQYSNAAGWVDSRVTLSEWMHKWVASREIDVAPNTMSGYRTDLRYIDRSGVGAMRLDQVSTGTIDALFVWLIADGKSYASCQHLKRTLNPALKMAEDQGYLARNPVSRVKARGTTEPLEEPFNVQEVMACLAAISKRRNGVRWDLAIQLGLRRGEALGLRWTDIDLDHAVLYVRHSLHWRKWKHGCTDSGDKPCKQKAYMCPKRHSGGPQIGNTKTAKSVRTEALQPTLVQRLREHHAAQQLEREAAGESWHPWDLVIATPLGRPILFRSDWEDWEDVKAQLGSRDLRIHDLRHTWATTLNELGVDTRVAQDLAGWTSSKQAERYIKVRTTVLHEVAAKQEVLYAIDEGNTTDDGGTTDDGDAEISHEDDGDDDGRVCCRRDRSPRGAVGSDRAGQVRECLPGSPRSEGGRRVEQRLAREGLGSQDDQLRVGDHPVQWDSGFVC